MLTNLEIESLVARIEPDLIALRRRIHEHPELAFEEHETAHAVSDYLSALAIPHRTGVGKTGVVAVIDGGAAGPTVGVRADMDALPIGEASGVPFASRVPGRMHACGHDVHTTIALGVAHLLAGARAALPGRVKLIFQPAEETLAGAAAMIADGVLDDPAMDAIVGFHNSPRLETGLLAYTEGIGHASAAAFDIVLKGRTGHAAHPHVGIDAIVGAAQLVTQLQTIVSREIAPTVPAVVTIGQIAGGTARNVIADRVIIKGTARTRDALVEKHVEEAIRRVVAGVAAGARLEYEIDWVRQTPVTKYDSRVVARMVEAAREVVGADKVINLSEPTMGSEDFAWFAERVPAAHLRIGSRIEGVDTAIHRADYQCNERAIAIGVRAVTRVVLRLLERWLA
ncbi:MAG: N-acyl-L-amino acid amidohydrolase [Betaproteobacteria bacterium RIFCSPLOWO2_02_64_14]|nr:MAG: N-acyl-L-amino acid amidohydrolase [Betaproteobacteria bacterium RIFCSPLOWO2_02_64_14]